MQPYYEDSHVTLYHGDNRDVVPTLAGVRVDLLLSDPPYGVGWDTDYRRCQRAGTLSFPPSTTGKHWEKMAGEDRCFDPRPWLTYPQVILWGAPCYSNRLPMGRWLVWDKRFTSGKSFFPSDGEVAWQKGGHGLRLYAQTWQGVCRSKPHASERSEHGGVTSWHPTQKPVALAQWCIARAKRVTTLLDPYAGSGWTLIAAKTLGIRAIGVEIVEQYAETAARRLERTRADEGALA